MECQRHHKRAICHCSWCGEGLCRICVAKRLGNQQYCAGCVKSIGNVIEQEQIRRMREV